MKFTKRNKLHWIRDHAAACGVGVPAGVDFDVEPFSENGFRLRACGYGCLDRHTESCYGNGALYVWTSSYSQRKRLAGGATLTRGIG